MANPAPIADELEGLPRESDGLIGYSNRALSRASAASA